MKRVCTWISVNGDFFDSTTGIESNSAIGLRRTFKQVA